MPEFPGVPWAAATPVMRPVPFRFPAQVGAAFWDPVSCPMMTARAGRAPFPWLYVSMRVTKNSLYPLNTYQVRGTVPATLLVVSNLICQPPEVYIITISILQITKPRLREGKQAVKVTQARSGKPRLGVQAAWLLHPCADCFAKGPLWKHV